MSPNVVTVGKETPLLEVVRLMEEHAIRRIPVIEDDRVVGIVSRADLMSALAELLIKPTNASPSSDESIRQMILTEMKRQPWCPVQSLGIRVRKGFVDLSGTIFDPAQRQALRVLVENVPGVKGFHDHLGEFIEQTVAAPGEKPSAQRSKGASRSPA